MPFCHQRVTEQQQDACGKHQGSVQWPWRRSLEGERPGRPEYFLGQSPTWSRGCSGLLGPPSGRHTPSTHHPSAQARPPLLLQPWHHRDRHGGDKDGAKPREIMRHNLGGAPSCWANTHSKRFPTVRKVTLLLGLTKTALGFFVGETEETKDAVIAHGLRPADLVAGTCQACHGPSPSTASLSRTGTLRAPRGRTSLPPKQATPKGSPSSQEHTLRGGGFWAADGMG